MTTSPETEAICFDALVKAAVEGGRCPENNTFGVRSDLVGILAIRGKIKIEIFALNFRRITILQGEHAGKQTASPATGSRKPWKIIDATGTRKMKRLAPQQPSAPRGLTSAEIEQ